MTEQNKKQKSTASFALGELWQAQIAYHCSTESIRELTSKERGQLKTLAEKLGPYTRPAIAFAIQNWDEFAPIAAARDGVNGYPERPHVGFLLVHGAVAVNTMIEKGLVKWDKAYGWGNG